VIAAIHAPPLDFAPLAPELILTGTGIVLLVGGALAPRRSPSVLLGLTLVALAAAAVASLALWNWDGPASVLGRMVAADRFGVVSRLILLAAAAIGALYGYHYFSQSRESRFEFYPLLLFALSGMTLLTVADDLIVVFLSLEVLSLSLYVLTAFGFRTLSSEAAMKYFLLGAFSSAFLLFGIAMAYGATGTTNIGDVARALAGRTGTDALALTAVGLLLVGFGFKVSAVPFHMWTPDVYQGAPTSITAFMSATTKVAAFLGLVRVLDVSFQPLTASWLPLVAALAALSMIVGAVLAIAQTDVKRMLAYSSIAHAGYVLTGFTVADHVGITAALFYLVACAASVLGGFGAVMLASGGSLERSDLDSFRGLSRRSPLLAALMTLFLLSLAGIPPTVGFIGKVTVFSAAVRAGYWPLVLVGVLTSVVAAFFYIRVIVLMYMQESETEVSLDAGPATRLVLAVPAILVLVLGVFPGIVVPFLEKASIIRW